ncbi:TPA_asm: protein 4 [Caladenia virus 1]|uniref:Protein 4 n=1 Tax=Caladenia virus 1 TaxID=2977961 RepID=A0A9N6YJC2_9RHAB|nr:TPA_asm: protein 4 [Caladenia virus 1]
MESIIQDMVRIIEHMLFPFCDLYNSEKLKVSSDMRFEILSSTQKENEHRLNDLFLEISIPNGFCWLCDATNKHPERAISFSHVKTMVNQLLSSSERESFGSLVPRNASLCFTCMMNILLSKSPTTTLNRYMRTRFPKIPIAQDLSGDILKDTDDSLYYDSFSDLV